MRDLPQLGHGGAQLGHALVQETVDVDRALVEVALRQPQCHPERDEPLLGPVVEVALQAAALALPDRHQLHPAGLDVAQRPSQLEPKPDHVHQADGRSTDRVQQLAGPRRRRRGQHRHGPARLADDHPAVSGTSEPAASTKPSRPGTT